MNFKTKDFVLLGIVASMYTIIFLLVGFTSQALPVIGHILSTSLMALVLGTVILFTLYKIPKLGVFTLFHLILLALMSLLGMFYLPWFMSILVTAILADIIANTSKYQSRLKNAIGYGLINTGIQLGGIIPVWFFADEYAKTWIQKGMNPEHMQASINAVAGYAGLVIICVAFLAGFLGIYIGYKILNKHFAKSK